MNDLTVVIPAACPGRRMRSYGPKALIEIGKETVVSRQVRLIGRAFPGADVVVVAGFRADRVAGRLPAGVRLVENEAYEETGVGRSIELALRASNCKRALVVYGDLVFNEAALRGLPARSCLLTSGGTHDGVGCAPEGGLVHRLDYGLPRRWLQVASLWPRELELFRRAVACEGRRRQMGYEILNAVIKAGGEFAAAEPKGARVVEIDEAKDIARAMRV